jgi:hypothetical protein
MGHRVHFPYNTDTDIDMWDSMSYKPCFSSPHALSPSLSSFRQCLENASSLSTIVTDEGMVQVTKNGRLQLQHGCHVAAWIDVPSGHRGHQVADIGNMNLCAPFDKYSDIELSFRSSWT